MEILSDLYEKMDVYFSDLTKKQKRTLNRAIGRMEYYPDVKKWISSLSSRERLVIENAMNSWKIGLNDPDWNIKYKIFVELVLMYTARFPSSPIESPSVGCIFAF